jgi:hypothetical protein
MELTNLYDQARMLVKAGALRELEKMIDRHQQLVALRDIPDNRGMQNTLLHEVTGMGELDWPETAAEIAVLLIEKGSAVDATEQEDQGETPLHHAVSINNVEVAEVLLKKGADPEKNRPLRRHHRYCTGICALLWNRYPPETIFQKLPRTAD